MQTSGMFEQIKRALETAPPNGYVAELQLQILKHADLLEGMSGREFCEKLDLNRSWGAEFAKMKKISRRLRDAGLRPELI